MINFQDQTKPLDFTFVYCLDFHTNYLVRILKNNYSALIFLYRVKVQIKTQWSLYGRHRVFITSLVVDKIQKYKKIKLHKHGRKKKTIIVLSNLNGRYATEMTEITELNGRYAAEMTEITEITN